MEYIDNLYSNVTTALSSIGTKLLLKESFNNMYYSKKPEDDDLYSVFSVTLYKEEESTREHNELKDFIAEYHIYEFKDFFGMSLSEFMELTRSQKDAYIEELKLLKMEKRKADEESLNQLDAIKRSLGEDSGRR